MERHFQKRILLLLMDVVTRVPRPTEDTDDDDDDDEERRHHHHHHRRETTTTNDHDHDHDHPALRAAADWPRTKKKGWFFDRTLGDILPFKREEEDDDDDDDEDDEERRRRHELEESRWQSNERTHHLLGFGRLSL